MRQLITGRALVLVTATVLALLVLLAGSLPATRDARETLVPIGGTTSRLKALADDPDAARAAVARQATAFGTGAGLDDVPGLVGQAATTAGMKVVEISTGATEPTSVALDGRRVTGTTVTVTLEGPPAALPVLLTALSGSPRLMSVDHAVADPAGAVLTLTVFAWAS